MHLKKLILLLIFFHCIISINAQINTFNTGILPNGTYPSGALNIAENDTGYVFIGFGPLGKMAVSFIDTLGNFKNSKIYEYPNYAYKFEIDNTLRKLNNNNKSIYCLGTEIWDTSDTYYSSLLVKFDENYDTIFTKSYFTDTLYSGSGQFLEKENSNYIIVGYNQGSNNSGDFLLYSTDSLGNLLWYKNYGGTGTEQGYLLLKTYDNGYLLGGLTHSFGSNSPHDNGEWYLIKTDSLGNQQWQKHYGNPALNDDMIVSMCTTIDSCYLLAGAYIFEKIGSTGIFKSRLVKIDQYGNIIWDKLYGYKGRNNSIKEVHQIGNSDIITLSLTDSMSSYCGNINCVVHCLNYEGKVKWRRKYYFNNDTCSFWSFIKTFKPTSDGGYIFCGIGANVNMTPVQYTWVVKTDSLGFDGTYCYSDTAFNITLVTDTICYGDSALVYFHITGKSAPYSLELNNGNFHNSIYYPYTYESYATDSLYIYPQDSLINQQVIATLTDPFGEIFTDTFDIYIKSCETTIINKTIEKNRVNIYPNPTNNEINIEIFEETEPTFLEMYNNKGQLVYKSLISNKFEKFDVSKFTSGVYLIKLSNNKFSHIEKIVIN